MNIRFYRDPETGLPHIYGHNVNEEEVEEVLLDSIEDRNGVDGSRVAIGKTEGADFYGLFMFPILSRILYL